MPRYSRPICARLAPDGLPATVRATKFWSWQRYRTAHYDRGLAVHLATQRRPAGRQLARPHPLEDRAARRPDGDPRHKQAGGP